MVVTWLGIRAISVEVPLATVCGGKGLVYYLIQYEIYNIVMK